MLSPRKMEYTTMFPSDHFDDPFYKNPLLNDPNAMTESATILRTHARLFVGGQDWNPLRPIYDQEFDTEFIPEETHSFDENMESAKRIARSIVVLAQRVLSNTSHNSIS